MEDDELDEPDDVGRTDDETTTVRCSYPDVPFLDGGDGW